MFLEDIDFAARVRRAGYRIRYVGTRWAWHDCGADSERHEARLYALLPHVWITYLNRYGSRFERAVRRGIDFRSGGGNGDQAGPCARITFWTAGRDAGSVDLPRRYPAGCRERVSLVSLP